MKIGEYIKEARKNKKITLREMSSSSGISFSQLGKIERGEHKPGKDTLIKIASTLQIDPQKLLQLYGYPYKFEDAKNNNIDSLLRFKILNRDNFKCQLCGAGPPFSPVDVTHISSDYKGGEKAFENLVSLCNQCYTGREEFIKHEGIEKDILYRSLNNKKR